MKLVQTNGLESVKMWQIPAALGTIAVELQPGLRCLYILQIPLVSMASGFGLNGG